jgi:hypothetical protein
MNKLRWFAAALAVTAVAGPALAQHPGHETAQEQQQLAPTSAEARRADIAVFREQFIGRDAALALAGRRDEAEQRLAALEAQAADVNQAYFELELARIVALADNGHSVNFPGPRSRRFNRIADVRFTPFGEDLYVLRTSSANADLLGARLVAIDGRRVAQTRDAARTLSGGTSAWRERGENYLVESPEQMHALGLIERADRVSYRLQLTNGRTVTRRFTPEPANPDRVRANADRWLYPAPAEGEGEGWRALLNPQQAPWALQDPDTPFRMRDAPEIDAYVIEMRQNNPAPQIDIAAFMFDSLEAARTSGRRNIVLDLRMNGGGDLNYTRAWVRRLPRAVPGRVFVLTSPWTFSAAISTVGYLKQEAPDRVVIVGEMVGDRLDFHSEGEVFTLPHSGAAILNATERHDYHTGCRNIENCHGSVVSYPIAVESLAPDIEAPWTIEAYRAGHDPAIDAIAAALR